MRGSVAITVLAACAAASACTWDGGLGDARFADDVDDAPPWWDAAWSTRHHVTLTSSGPEVPADLLVAVPARRADLDVTDWDDVELVYWDGSSWTRRAFAPIRQADEFGDALWMALPRVLPAGGTEGGLWLYTGNPSPPTRLNPDSQYELVEYFDGPTLNAARWTGTGDVTFAGAQVHLGPGASITSVMTWPADHAVDVVVQNGAWANGMSVGFTGATWTYAANQLRPTVSTGAWTGTSYPAATGRFELAVERSPSTVRFLANSTAHDAHAVESSAAPVLLENTAASGPDLVIPSLRIRASVEDPPTGTIGPRVARF